MNPQTPSSRNNRQKRQEKQNLKANNEVKLDVVNPIPFEPSGSSAAFLLPEKQKPYIPFLNPKDNFFQVLFEASLGSPTTNSCINSKVFFCAGKGLTIKDGTDAEVKEFKKIQKRINNKRQSMGKVVDGLFNKYFRVGNDFIEIIRSKVGNTKKVMAFPRKFLECRLSEADENDVSQSVYISKKFRSNNNDWSIDVEKDAIELPIYDGADTKWYKDLDQGTEHCIIHVKNEMPGYDYYGMPENVASLPQQILEYKAARYNIDNFDNNLVLGGIVTLEGNYTDDELNKVAKKITLQHTGDGKRGRYAFISSKQGKAEVHDMKKQTDGDFLAMDEKVEQKIISSNNWDAALFGQNISKGIGNGGNAYVRTIFDIKNKTVIEPTREVIIEDFIIPFFEIYDDWMGTKWSEKEFSFIPVVPESFAGDIDANAILTVNEGREIFGKEPLPNNAGTVIISTNQKAKKDVSDK
ncbi:hypothetical protein [Chryseobacterium sp. SG20098]|uniref:hypothetical protein n=1 Tax=Chryseobacterium sp. SG20098 TaxID=3074145 RepID=UPI002883506B|nr:hypothetical protein [Chryseobacterium sp. SG20098]WNI34693.1 hypothetical protein RHP76_11920 [Chryseobacterium sp. SG20098]